MHQTPQEEYRLKLEKIGIKPLWPIDTIIYKYASVDTALKIIESNALMFSPPSVFNDPFDLANSLIDKSFHKTDLLNWLKKFDQLSNAQKKHLFKENRADPLKINQMINFTLNNFKSSAGISCFSKSYTNTLMWSHYADKHKGVCLGFTINPLDSKHDFMLLQVNYAESIVPLNYFKHQDTVLMYWLFTKAKAWEYEAEVRAVNTARNGLINFDKECMREMYFGLRCSPEERSLLKNKLFEFGYKIEKICEMQMNTKTFGLNEKSFN